MRTVTVVQMRACDLMAADTSVTGGPPLVVRQQGLNKAWRVFNTGFSGGEFGLHEIVKKMTGFVQDDSVAWPFDNVTDPRVEKPRGKVAREPHFDETVIVVDVPEETDATAWHLFTVSNWELWDVQVVADDTEKPVKENTE